jgi:hypothetical protein
LVANRPPLAAPAFRRTRNDRNGKAFLPFYDDDRTGTATAADTV